MIAQARASLFQAFRASPSRRVKAGQNGVEENHERNDPSRGSLNGPPSSSSFSSSLLLRVGATLGRDHDRGCRLREDEWSRVAERIDHVVVAAVFEGRPSSGLPESPRCIIDG